jgi:hypothetical protein
VDAAPWQDASPQFRPHGFTVHLPVFYFRMFRLVAMLKVGVAVDCRRHDRALGNRPQNIALHGLNEQVNRVHGVAADLHAINKQTKVLCERIER